MTPALVVVDGAAPEWTSDGQPICSERCPSHDGKRCTLIGFRAPQVCEPCLVAMAAEIDRLRALPVLRTCGDCRYEDGSGHWCGHPQTRGRAIYDDPDRGEPPPSWCALRARVVR